MPLTTGRQTLTQLVFCRGCCCGRTDRGRPEVPVERLQQVWRDEKLNRSVQLTVAGCVGPCDLANVALVLLPEGPVWLGDLAGSAVYELLIDWARACHAAGAVLPLPGGVEALRFERFQREEVGS